MTPSSNTCPACDGHGCYHVNGYKLDTCQVCEGAGIKNTQYPACGTAMGINPASGKLGCPHLACYYTTEISIKQTEIITMKHIITDEEAERFWGIYCKTHGSRSNSRKVALNDFLTNRPESTLGKLRPIAEMPETVPEGCVRYFFALHGDGALCHVDTKQINITKHAIDIQLPTPDPEADERQRFERWHNESHGLYPTWMGDKYSNPTAQDRFEAWEASKLAKAK